MCRICKLNNLEALYLRYNHINDSLESQGKIFKQNLRSYFSWNVYRHNSHCLAINLLKYLCCYIYIDKFGELKSIRAWSLWNNHNSSYTITAATISFLPHPPPPPPRPKKNKIRQPSTLRAFEMLLISVYITQLIQGLRL